jgi:hypothetical protein
MRLLFAAFFILKTRLTLQPRLCIVRIVITCYRDRHHKNYWNLLSFRKRLVVCDILSQS